MTLTKEERRQKGIQAIVQNTDKICGNKVQYDSKELALAGITELEEQGKANAGLKVYRCPVCKYYHFGVKRKRAVIVDEDAALSDIIEQFQAPDPHRQDKMSFSVNQIVGAIRLAYYRGIESGRKK